MRTETCQVMTEKVTLLHVKQRYCVGGQGQGGGDGWSGSGASLDMQSVWK